MHNYTYFIINKDHPIVSEVPGHVPICCAGSSSLVSSWGVKGQRSQVFYNGDMQGTQLFFSNKRTILEVDTVQGFEMWLVLAHGCDLNYKMKEMRRKIYTESTAQAILRSAGLNRGFRSTHLLFINLYSCEIVPVLHVHPRYSLLV